MFEKGAAHYLTFTILGELGFLRSADDDEVAYWPTKRE
jgi:hypothetical protein